MDMRSLFLLLLVAGAAVAGPAVRAGEVLIAGPETIVGSAELVPWEATASFSPALATDGDELVAVWTQDGSNLRYGNVYALRLDRDGRPLGTPRMLLEQETARDQKVRVLWVDGLYLVFHTDPSGRLAVLRMTRELEIVDIRWLALDAAGFDVAASRDELVIVTPSRVLRLRRDLTAIGELALGAPAKAVVRITAMSTGFAILIAHAPAVLVRQLDGSKLGAPVRISPVDGSGAAAIVWTGSQLAAAWLSCSPYGCQVSASVQVAWLDAGLRPAGEVARADEAGIVLCFGCEDILDLQPVGDETVFLTVSSPWGSSQGLRLRQGVTLGEKGVGLGPGARALFTAHGRLLAIDADLRLRDVPLDGNHGTEPLPETLLARSAAREWFRASAASADEVGVFRYRLRPSAGWSFLAAVMTHDGAPLHEIVIGPSVRDVGMASDGDDVYAVLTGSERPVLQKLAPGERAVPLYPFAGGSMLPLLAWTGSAFATVWEHPAHVRLVTPKGKFVESWCEENQHLQAEWSPDARLVAGGGELWLAEREAVRLSRDSCPVSPGEGTRWHPRLAWQNGTWGAVTGGEQGGLRLALSREGGPFVPSVASLPYTNVFGTALAALGGNWVLLRYGYTGSLEATLLDEDGDVLDTQTLSELASASATALLPLNDREVLAVYTRTVSEPPYYGVTRVVMRRLTMETAVRRRGVRQ